MSPTQTFKNLAPKKQKRILDGALSEFSAHGYARTSLNAVVARLGISKGSLFQYFNDKSGLFAAVFDFGVRMVKNALRGVREDTRGRDLFIRLEKSLLTGLRLIQNHPRLFQLYLRVLYESNVPCRTELLSSIRFFSRDYLMDLLTEARKAGELDPEMDLETAAFICDAVLERFLVGYAVEHMDLGLALHNARDEDAQVLAAKVVGALKGGLGA